MVEMADALVWLLDTNMHHPTPPATAVAVPGESYLSDDAVIAKSTAARKGRCSNGPGSVTSPGTRVRAKRMPPSLLRWYSVFSGDKAQMDRLFRRSGLMREKWNSLRGADTYGNIAIDKAAALMIDYYKPIIPRSATEDFGVERIKELILMDSSKHPWNAIDADQIFADFYRDRRRYVPEREMWFHYEGGVCKMDTGNLRAYSTVRDWPTREHLRSGDQR